MTITPILWTYDQLSDGTYSLKIRHSYVEGTKKVRKYYPMNIYLKENQWTGKRVKLGTHPNALDINLKLNEIETTIEREYLNNPGMNIEKLVKNILNPNIKNTQKPNILSYFRYYIQECRSGNILHYKTKQVLTEGYIKSFDTCLIRLEWYCSRKGMDPDFDDVTEDFYDHWMHELRYYYPVGDQFGLAENSMTNSTKRFKTMMEHAREKKIHNNPAHMKFVATWYDVDNIALSEEEVQAILNLDLSDKKHQYLIREQERFSMAYNFLLRFNDSISINKNNIIFQDDIPFFKMITGKTKQEVIIPIRPKNYEILKKNNFVLSTISNQKTNENIKELGRLAEITGDHTITEIKKGKIVQTTYKRYELITTHTTRRSAATNLYLSGMDLKSIQLFGGWKTLSQLETYLKIDKLDNAKKQAGHAFFNK